MSRPTPAGPLATRARGRSTGRHRLGSPTGVRVADIAVIRERMQVQSSTASRRWSFLEWLFQVPPTGRHTWSFLAGNGGRPRTAFAIILSL